MFTLQAEDGMRCTTATRMGSKRGVGELQQLAEEEGENKTGKMPLTREIEDHAGSQVNQGSKAKMSMAETLFSVRCPRA